MQGDEAVSDSSQPSDTGVTTKPVEKEKTHRYPPFNVILENDDFHSFEFVIEVLRKALGCTEQRAFQFTEMAHRTGRAIVWTGTREVAELKMEQMVSFHEVQ